MLGWGKSFLLSFSSHVPLSLNSRAPEQPVCIFCIFFFFIACPNRAQRSVFLAPLVYLQPDEGRGQGDGQRDVPAGPSECCPSLPAAGEHLLVLLCWCLQPLLGLKVGHSDGPPASAWLQQILPPLASYSCVNIGFPEVGCCIYRNAMGNSKAGQ